MVLTHTSNNRIGTIKYRNSHLNENKTNTTNTQRKTKNRSASSSTSLYCTYNNIHSTTEMHKTIRNNIRNVNIYNKEKHNYLTILPTSTNTNLDNANQAQINITKGIINIRTASL